MAGSVLRARYRFVAGVAAPGGGGYINDRAIPATGVTLVKNFVVPPDMNQAQATALVNAVGGEIISFGDVEIVPGTRNLPCSDSNNFKPRKLKFIRANGNSISIVLPVRANAIAARDAGITALNGITAANPVVCVQLIGEEYINIYDELVPAGTAAPTAGAPSRAPAARGKGGRFSGVMTAYLSDVPNGAVTLAKFAMNTDTFTAAGLGQAPAIIGIAGVTCLGTIQQGGICPPSAAREPRHYSVTFLVTGDAAGTVATQVTKVPVANNTPAEIVTCGQGLAALASSACLGYKGESYGRLHLLTAAAAA